MGTGYSATHILVLYAIDPVNPSGSAARGNGYSGSEVCAGLLGWGYFIPTGIYLCTQILSVLSSFRYYFQLIGIIFSCDLAHEYLRTPFCSAH